ncbi:MAG TPA: FKBP-type peptidyl-prolyl cis-trans isomerase [Myxococcaceae bacterium]|nr:FKBP-type peptidyl-prolyl cis-trans isomerase [Myxococcaceae bacterium]
MRKTMKAVVTLVAVMGASAALAAAEPAKPGAAPAPGAAGAKPGAPADAPKKEDPAEKNKTLYALGLSIGKSLSVFNLSKEELEQVKKGLTDQVTGQKPQVELDTYGPKIQELARSRASVKTEAEKKKSVAFLEKSAKEPGVQKTASGLIFKETKAGTGENPKATDTVKVHYKGTLIDGTEFDSSYKRGEPASFALNQVIPCWTEGVQKLKAGGKARLVCPSEIAYGDRGAPPTIPGGATLIFEVELLEIVKNAGGASQPGQQK